MNTEQERAEFEAMLGRGKTYDERDFRMYQLGRRAALQSQEREDALTELLDSIDELLKTQERSAWTSKYKYSMGERMNAGMRYQKARQAIDHARRIHHAI